MIITMESNFEALERWIAVTVARLSPAEQRQLLRRVGEDLRRVNARRIGAQTTPDGSTWLERKPQERRRARKGKMMLKLRQRGHLRQKLIGDGVRVGFFGRDGYLANVHHYGKSQQLRYGIAKYPRRELLGINEADQAMIRESLLRHLHMITNP